jgi:hypothetical protein
MLLQTVKSRNLWLWGETVMPAEASSEAQKLKANIQDLEKEKSKLSQKIVENNIEGDIKGYTSINVIEEDELSKINEKLNQQRGSLAAVSNTGEYVANNITYKRTFTDPFMITALQNVSFDWDNPIGESYGIKTNFLQAWHNKPVNIMVSGLSYIGAYGGKTVGTLSQKDDSSGAFGLNLGVNTAIEGTISQLNKMSSDYLSKTSNAYDTIVDDDIYKINKLMSLYGEGIYTSAGSDVASSWIHLLLENDPGGQDSDDQYVAFIGHIKKFTYKEDVSKPFLYQFDFTFVGEPAITKNINEAKIHAEQDRNSLKLTVVASDTGYSLGYGF